MSVRTRADLAALPGYVPGRSIPGAIKLASNEVSLGPLPSVVDAIARAATQINRYPDTGSGELVATLARKLDIAIDQVSVGCGSVTLCEQLIQATCADGDEVMFAWRSFEAYPILTHVVGAAQLRVPLAEDYSLDIDAMLAAITPKTRLIYFCNPNNPTGRAHTRAEIERFIEAVPSDVLIVIDEAYREFVDDADVPDGVDVAKDAWAAGRDNVAVLRTFSKAYGLAGLRVGYLVAAPGVVAAVNKVFVPFAVNSIAQVAALASLEAEDELFARCREIVAERGRVREALLALGFEVPVSQANFVWLPLGEATAAFNEHCLEQKIIVRAFAGEGARVTIGTAEENDAFLAAAGSYQR